jgi:hypothetical protein
MIYRAICQMRRLSICCGVFLAACSTPTSSRQDSATPGPPPCTITDQNTPAKDKDAITQLRRTVETGPLYGIPAASGVGSCSAASEAGVITIEYKFRNGAWLRVKRDPRIEYNDQEARFEMPQGENPIAVMKSMELGAFGKDGCGIDWTASEKQPAEDDAQASETIFRGDTCNCQVRIRSNAAGQTVGLRLRSTC